MNNKLNIQELKELIPDFITGDISNENIKLLENALISSTELREFHDEIKSTLEFVDNVKPDEPSPVYWNSLLPRIHQRIEENESKGFSWDKILSYWKIIVPVAAILLIAVFYFAFKQPGHEITKDEQKKENIQKDSSGKDSNKQELKKDNETPALEEKNNVTGNEDRTMPKIIQKDKKKLSPLDDVPEDVVKEDNEIKKDGNNANDQKSEKLAAIDIDDISIFATGEGAGLDEDTENELKRLSDNEKDNLIEELINSNL
ncbi:MAG: hypothetical protein K8I03_03010 [Ignavibacteria bacterium]|nr:hypothetical protein [Ignavibacteria bacterium]